MKTKNNQTIFAPSKEASRFILILGVAFSAISSFALLGLLSLDIENFRAFFLTTLLLGIVGTFYSYYIKEGETYFFGDSFLKIQTGLFVKSEKAILFNHISNIEFHQNIIDRIFNTGTLILSTTGDTGKNSKTSLLFIEKDSELLQKLQEKINKS
jgi:uncharacterized membrane protein YdbT with pleckstrin-like domain